MYCRPAYRLAITALLAGVVGCGFRSPVVVSVRNPLPVEDYTYIQELTSEEVEQELQDVEVEHDDIDMLREMLYNRLEELQFEETLVEETLVAPLVASPGFTPDLRTTAITPLDAAGDTVEWDYSMLGINSGCPDPMNPQLDPGCAVARFMIWDGIAWWDAGMMPGPNPDTFRFTFPNQYDPAKTQIQACNDIGTMMGQWDAQDGCSSGGGRLFEIDPPTNPRFLLP